MQAEVGESDNVSSVRGPLCPDHSGHALAYPTLPIRSRDRKHLKKYKEAERCWEGGGGGSGDAWGRENATKLIPCIRKSTTGYLVSIARVGLADDFGVARHWRFWSGSVYCKVHEANRCITPAKSLRTGLLALVLVLRACVRFF